LGQRLAFGENVLMKAVIMAGGQGTRISEETAARPKPMIEIGGKPILWHIMKIYSAYGINDFVICCGYRGYMIKEYFANYALHMSDVTFDLSGRSAEYLSNESEPWKVTLVDTGELTQTGGRLKRVAKYIQSETFCLTYGDGVATVDIGKLLDFHKAQARSATITAVQPPGRFGSLSIVDDRIDKFVEKPMGDGGWINGGFFVLEPTVLKYLVDDQTIWEHEPLAKLAAEGELSAYKHFGFWHPLDTLRDSRTLNSLWETGKAPWQVW
jgi:glucose-1-phosphate cytidylyltransferase